MITIVAILFDLFTLPCELSKVIEMGGAMRRPTEILHVTDYTRCKRELLCELLMNRARINFKYTALLYTL
jgi:hypothetical protein